MATHAIATVYDPPDAGLPHVAVILWGGKVIFAEAVKSVAEGESLVAHMMQGIADLVAKNEKK